MSIADAMGAFLSGFTWTHFVTLTTKLRRSEEVILRIFQQRFLRPLARVTQSRIPHFYAIEGTLRQNGFPHIHALLGQTETLPVAVIERTWHEGFSRVTKYDPAKGAAFYLTKEIATNPDGYGISRRLPERWTSRAPLQPIRNLRCTEDHESAAHAQLVTRKGVSEGVCP